MKSISSFKGTDEFAAWFGQLADFARLQSSTLIEHALVGHAKAIGFDKPPPKR